MTFDKGILGLETQLSEVSNFLVCTPVFALVICEGVCFCEVNVSFLIQNVLVDVDLDYFSEEEVVGA